MIARTLTALAPLLCSACFDFDATMAGGPLVDFGTAPKELVDANVNDGSLRRHPRPRPAKTLGTDHRCRGDRRACRRRRSRGPVLRVRHRSPRGSLLLRRLRRVSPPSGASRCSTSLAGSIVDTDNSLRARPRTRWTRRRRPSRTRVTDRSTSRSAPADRSADGAWRRADVRVQASSSVADRDHSRRTRRSSSARSISSTTRGTGTPTGSRSTSSTDCPRSPLGEQSGLVDGSTFLDGALPVFTNHPAFPTSPMPMNQWTDLSCWSSTGPRRASRGRSSSTACKGSTSRFQLTVQPTSLQIGIGTSFVTEYEAGPSPVWELRYDNVLFTAN